MSLLSGGGSTANVTRRLARARAAHAGEDVPRGDHDPPAGARVPRRAILEALAAQASGGHDRSAHRHALDSRHEPAARRLRRPARRPPARPRDRQQGRRELQERGRPPRRTRRAARTTSGCRSSTAIVVCGGDAIYEFEAADEPFLDHRRSRSTATARSTRGSPPCSATRRVMTGRVFAANGPWVRRRERPCARGPEHAAPPQATRRRTTASCSAGWRPPRACRSTMTDNPHRWEGMADVATVGDRVVMTYAVPGHYDAGVSRRAPRSAREGVAFAAITPACPRPRGSSPSSSTRTTMATPSTSVPARRGARRCSSTSRAVCRATTLLSSRGARSRSRRADRSEDAVDQYAGNSRQVAGGVLVPDGVSACVLASSRGSGWPSPRPAVRAVRPGGRLRRARPFTCPARWSGRIAPASVTARAATCARARKKIAERVRVDPG